jgi:hypothetical protein
MVSFKQDVEPFLISSCGNGVGLGCHVVDNMTTSAVGGFDHAYDWITAGSHSSSCPASPTPKRFEIAIAVIESANPPACAKSRQMPPPGVGTPLTACQIEALRAWLAEPPVTQMHRTDDSSPSTPYPMPPFN